MLIISLGLPLQDSLDLESAAPIGTAIRKPGQGTGAWQCLTAWIKNAAFRRAYTQVMHCETERDTPIVGGRRRYRWRCRLPLLEKTGPDSIRPQPRGCW